MGGKHKETGQYAYEAYANAVSPSAGYRVQWDELPEEIRDAWREAAHAVMRYGWQDPDPPQAQQGWEHKEWHTPSGDAWFAPDDDTRTSHRTWE